MINEFRSLSPQAKFLIAVDCVTPGYAPFQGFDITTNFHDEYLKVFDEALIWRFVLIHNSRIRRSSLKKLDRK